MFEPYLSIPYVVSLAQRQTSDIWLRCTTFCSYWQKGTQIFNKLQKTALSPLPLKWYAWYNDHYISETLALRKKLPTVSLEIVETLFFRLWMLDWPDYNFMLHKLRAPFQRGYIHLNLFFKKWENVIKEIFTDLLRSSVSV